VLWSWRFVFVVLLKKLGLILNLSRILGYLQRKPAMGPESPDGG
jgi:hypothetical protein